MTHALPAFSQIDLENIESHLDQRLAENKATIGALLASETLTHPTWENLVAPLEDKEDELNQFWSPISHLHAVKQSPRLQEIYHRCLQKLTAYFAEVGQNKNLYLALKKLAENASYADLQVAQRQFIQNELKAFRLAGVDLSEQNKERYRSIKTSLAALENAFGENVLAATEAWSYLVTHDEELQGLPPHVLLAAEEAARRKQLTGWLLTLDYPSYFSIVRYADNRQLRERLYRASVTRASEQGDVAWDNSKNLFEILKLRHELSQLLGFNHYAELSLASNKMVKEPQRILDFLYQLAQAARPKALEDFQVLQAFAKEQDGVDKLEAWDIAYYSEKLCRRDYGLTDELLRPYFPIQHVLKGLFALTQRLYGMQIAELHDVDVWHPDVKAFSIVDSHQQLRGQFYLDLYARAQKQEGAWMDECRQRRKLNQGTIQTPVAYITCNFTPPFQDKPGLLTHEEVLTLFHEFGHALQHLLTQVDVAGVSGIRGVDWDAVELPSQFMECFAWEKEVLSSISAHYLTNEPLPEDFINAMQAAKKFQAGLHLSRQAELALFDFRLHAAFDPSQGYDQVQNLLTEIRTAFNVTPVPAFNRFQHSFSHIFSGSYAAGYYSYLWAEVMSADAFAQFEEEGIFNPETGNRFLKTILEQGGAKEALTLFKLFRGREPDPSAFLRHWGVTLP